MENVPAMVVALPSGKVDVIFLDRTTAGDDGRQCRPLQHSHTEPPLSGATISPRCLSGRSKRGCPAGRPPAGS